MPSFPIPARYKIGLFDASSGLETGVPADILSATVLPFNVRDFGAVGDGVTDDTAAFQRAIDAAGAAVEFFGTTVISSQVVFVPVTPSPAGQTKSYLITNTLNLPRGILVYGQGPQGAVLNFVPPGANSTLFTFFGTTEGQSAQIRLENLFCFQNTTTPSSSIGFRMRNCGFIQLRNCIFSNFRVGAWMDWGQDFEAFDSTFSLCIRGAQLGGNLGQTESPAPPAGIRGGPGTAWFDNGCFMFCKFSQNQVDLNHLGSIQSHGNTLVQNCTFFESATSPITGKTRFIHTTSLKGLMVQDSWFESGTNTRTGIVQAATDYDGNAGATNLGAVVQGNHFLLTGGAGVIGVDIEAGSATISSNVLEIAAGVGVHLKLNDNTLQSTVFGNTYLDFPDTNAVGRLTLNGVHQLLGAAGAAGQGSVTLGKVTISDPSVAQVEFQLAGVRKAGMNVVAADAIRFYDSGGTVKYQFVMGTAGQIVGPSTSISLRNNANNADNLLVADIGTVQARDALKSGVGASGAAVATKYRTENVLFQASGLSTSSTSDVSLAAFTLLGTSLGANGQAVRILVRGSAVTQAAVPNVKFGATVVATGSVTAGNVFEIDIIVTRTGATAQIAVATIDNGTVLSVNSRTTPTETLSGDLTIDFRGSVTAGGTLNVDYAMIEYLAA